MAERVGFEPTDRCRSTVFETARFGHSRTSPYIGKLCQVMVRGWSCLSRRKKRCSRLRLSFSNTPCVTAIW